MANADASTMKIWVGRHVELELKYENLEVERLSLDIVADNAADFDNGLLGESTPLAKAILGKQVGAVISYHAGDIIEVRVLTVSVAKNEKPVDLSERREETQQKAIQDSDRTSLIIYASSMNSKWGEYDPGVLKENTDHSEEDEDQM